MHPAVLLGGTFHLALESASTGTFLEVPLPRTRTRRFGGAQHSAELLIQHDAVHGNGWFFQLSLNLWDGRIGANFHIKLRSEHERHIPIFWICIVEHERRAR